MKDKIEVSVIEIVIGKTVLRLSPEELKELQDILNDTFPQEKTVHVPSYPVVIERPNLFGIKTLETMGNYLGN